MGHVDEVFLETEINVVSLSENNTSDDELMNITALHEIRKTTMAKLMENSVFSSALNHVLDTLEKSG